MRGRVIVAALVLLYIVVGAVIIVGSYGDPCMNGTGGSCPGLADVDGNRYMISGGDGFEVVEGDLSPFAPISRTNSPGMFAELTAFRIGDIDPLAVLAAAAGSTTPHERHFRLLFGSNQSAAWPSLCDYFTFEAKMRDAEHCGVPA